MLKPQLCQIIKQYKMLNNKFKFHIIIEKHSYTILKLLPSSRFKFYQTDLKRWDKKLKNQFSEITIKDWAKRYNYKINIKNNYQQLPEKLKIYWQ